MKRVALLAILLLATTVGCVERKMFLRTEPSGAEVVLNYGDFPARRTPCVVDFAHYGTYAVRAEKEGYLTLETGVEVAAPWWGYPPLDFFVDVLWPFTVEDHRAVTLALEPLPAMAPVEEVRAAHEGMLERAEEFRRRVNEGDPARIRGP